MESDPNQNHVALSDPNQNHVALMSSCKQELMIQENEATPAGIYSYLATCICSYLHIAMEHVLFEDRFPIEP